MNRKELVGFIENAQESFRVEHGVEPTHIRLTREIRNSISGWSRDEVGGDLVGKISLEGVEIAMPTVFGLVVLEWNAAELSVDIKPKTPSGEKPRSIGGFKPRMIP